MKNMTLLFGIFLLAQGISAAGLAENSLTTKDRPVCSSHEPCSLKVGSIEFKVHFDIEKFGTLDVVAKVHLRNTKSGQVTSYTIQDNDGYEPGTQVRIYIDDINSDGFSDLALFTTTSAKDGFLYYYFVFNPKDQKFVKSDIMVPELKAGKQGQVLGSVSSRNKYIVDSKYKVRAK